MIGGFITWIVTSRLGRLVGAAWGVIAIVGLVFLKGMSVQKAKDKRQKEKAKRQTLERIDNVQINTDRESALKRLRGSGRLRDEDTL